MYLYAPEYARAKLTPVAREQRRWKAARRKIGAEIFAAVLTAALSVGRCQTLLMAMWQGCRALYHYEHEYAQAKRWHPGRRRRRVKRAQPCTQSVAVPVETVKTRQPWPRRRARRHLLGGLVAALLLLPIPAYASLTFSKWLFTTNAPSVISAQADSTNTIISFTPFTAGSGDLIVGGFGTATWTGGNAHLLATFNNWGTLTAPRAGQVNFQVTYGATTLTTGNVNVNGLNNQFALGPTALISGTQLVSFRIEFLAGSTWGAPSTPVTLVFSNPS
jgi:hypothetical protein